ATDRDLRLYYDNVASLSAEQKIELAKRAERSALDFDPRISNSEGGAFGSSWSRRVLANSRGFQGEYRRSWGSLHVVPVAHAGEEMQRDYWYSISHDAAALESPESVGRQAAERALRRLGAVKVESARVPVIFEPRTARTLLDHLFEAVNGDSIYRHALFLAGQFGPPLAAPRVTL